MSSTPKATNRSGPADVLDDVQAEPLLAARSLNAPRPKPSPKDVTEASSNSGADDVVEAAGASRPAAEGGAPLSVRKGAAMSDDQVTTSKRPAPRPADTTSEPRTVTIRLPSLRRRTGTRARARRRTWILAAAVTVVLIALLVTDLVLNMKVGDRGDVNRARTQAVQQATTRVPKMLSYAYSSLAVDLKTASEQTTGKFHTEYQQVLDKVVKPSATSKKITTKTVVTGTSVIQATASHVVVLVFLTQSTSTSGGATPLVQGSRVNVTMTKTGGTWLVSALDPV